MKKNVCAVGGKVYLVAENGDTLELTGENGGRNFEKALNGDWPEDNSQNATDKGDTAE